MKKIFLFVGFFLLVSYGSSLADISVRNNEVTGRKEIVSTFSDVDFYAGGTGEKLVFIKEAGTQNYAIGFVVKAAEKFTIGQASLQLPGAFCALPPLGVITETADQETFMRSAFEASQAVSYIINAPSAILTITTEKEGKRAFSLPDYILGEWKTVIKDY